MINDVYRSGKVPALGTDSGNQSLIDFNIYVDGVFYPPHGTELTLNGGKDDRPAIRALTDGNGQVTSWNYYDPYLGQWLTFDTGVSVELQQEIANRIAADADLQEQIYQKANSADINSPINIEYADLVSNTYTNLTFANQFVVIIYYDDNGLQKANATFNSDGILTLPFTAPVGWSGELIGITGALGNYYTQEQIDEMINNLGVPAFAQIGVESPASGNSSSERRTYIFEQPVPNGYFSKLRVYVATGGTVLLKRFKLSTDGLSYEYISETSVTVSAGLNTLDVVPNYYDAGDYIGVYNPTGAEIRRYTSSTEWCPWKYGALDTDITTDVTLTSLGQGVSTSNIQIGFDFGYEDWFINLKNSVALNTDFRESIEDLFEFETNVYGKSTIDIYSNSASTGYTYVFTTPIGYNGVVTGINFWSKVVGTVTVKVFSRSGTEYTWKSEQVVTTSAGLNNAVLDSLQFSNGDVIGIYPSANNVIGFDIVGNTHPFVYFAGNITTSAIGGTPNASEEFEINFNFTNLSKVSPNVEVSDIQEYRRNIILSETFAVAQLPDTMENVGVPWTYATGSATPVSVGLANSIQGTLSDNFSILNSSALFVLESSDAKAMIYNRPVTFAASGTIAVLDIALNSLVVYRPWNGSNTLPSVYSTYPLVNITLAQDVLYKVAISKSYKQVVFTVYDMVTGANDVFTVTETSNTLTGGCGYSYGKVGIGALSGTVSFGEIMQNVVGDKDPYVIFYGDSMTEGYNLPIADNYAYQAVQNLNGSAYTSAQSTCKAVDVIERLNYELYVFSPRFIHVLIGANDTVLATWSANIDTIAELITAAGATPVFGCVPPSASNTFADFNADLLAKNYLTVRYDRAVTVGNDGITRDASLYLDSQHLNALGNTAMYNRLLLDAPYLFEI